MDLTKNQKIAIGAGCGCLVLVFIIVMVSGGLAFLAFNRGGEPAQQEQPATGGDKGTTPQPVAGSPDAPATGGEAPSADQGSANLPEAVRRQLAQANDIARQQGYTPVGGPASGALRNQTQEDVSVTLTSGGQYLMVGVCDGDCSDMDLRLFAPTGEEVAQDIATDDTPVLRFTANASGAHQARVIMATCTNEPCAYGVALYSKQ
jgi:hypothetical protein